MIVLEELPKMTSLPYFSRVIFRTLPEVTAPPFCSWAITFSSREKFDFFLMLNLQPPTYPMLL